MNKTGWIKKTLACFLVATLMVCAPFTNVPKNAFAAGEDEAAEEATDEGTKLYIKELRLGEGPKSEDALKSLRDGGYLILEKDGQPVNLNEDSASHNLFSSSPSDIYVYLGYKTTTNPDEAITDMAVMNMKGGYSFDDYAKLIEKELDTKIKPFMDKFVDTIREYRENYAKPEASVNHVKADMVRQLLNRYTDDDTDGSPIGDLLLNETKYEMGDKAYDALSDSDKKKHADIITMLMQANLMNLSMIEKYLVRAADASDDTWLDRFEKTSLDQLYEEAEEANPDTTKDDIDKILDKKYNDAAKQILDSWDEYAEIMGSFEDKQDELTAASEELEEKVDELQKSNDSENMDEEQQDDRDREILKIENEFIEQQQDAIAVGVSSQVQEKETDDMSMRDFFSQPAESFKGKDIRKLYPMIASLSKGQIAGLQFLSVADLLDAGVNNVANLKNSIDKIEEIPVVSVYEGVNREVFESGKVALTNDALRQNAVTGSDDTMNSSLIENAALGLATLATGITALGVFMKSRSVIHKMQGMSQIEHTYDWFKLNVESIDLVSEEQAALLKSAHRLRVVSGIFTGVMAFLAIVTAISFATDYMNQYRVNFSPIPKYIVDETDITTINDKGEKEFIRNETSYYRVVECNRSSLKVEKDYVKFYQTRTSEIGDYGDLNGAGGKEWLALYTVKYKNAAPILADSLLVKTGKDSATVPDDYKTGIHMFGEKSAYNLQNKKFLYREPEELRIYFKQDMEVRIPETGYTAEARANDDKFEDVGAIVAGGSNILLLGIGFAAGAIVVWFVMFVTRKRKKDTTSK